LARQGQGVAREVTRVDQPGEERIQNHKRLALAGGGERPRKRPPGGIRAGYFAALATPPNAHLANTATGWECDRRYHLAGERCAQVFIPFNAHQSTDGGHYERNYGYRDIGMSCSPQAERLN
jgi:hypothetical protein